MNYGEIKERLLGVLGRPAMPLAYTLAYASLDRSLRIVQMEKTVTLIASSGGLALPADFLEVQSLKGSSGSFYTPVGHEVFAQIVGPCGAARFLVGDGTIKLSPAPDDGAEFDLIHFAKLAALVLDTDTNAALDSVPEAFVYSVLAHHAKLIRDAKSLQFWERQAGAAVAVANQAAIKARNTGGTLSVLTKGTIV